MKMIVKDSWPELDYMPGSSVSYPRGGGYNSVADLQSQLLKRLAPKHPEIIPNGIRYSEQFNAYGETGLRVFEVTLGK